MLGMRCHVIDALDAIGGQCTALYPEKPIYDIPGFRQISAQDLVGNLESQAQPFGPVYHLGQTVETLSRHDQGWQLQTSTGTILRAKVVIVAAGCGAFGPNRPPLDGIDAYEGKSVFYMVTRREAFRDKRLVIAGGGDTAVDWIVSLAEIAAHITVVHRRPKFRAAPEMVARMQALAEEGKITFAVPGQLAALEGSEGRLSAVILDNLAGERQRVAADMLLPFYGLAMSLGPIATWGFNLDHSHIAVDPSTLETNESGIFAIGDICTYPGKLKLILSGFSESAMACHAAYALVNPDQALHFEYSTSKGVPDPENGVKNNLKDHTNT